MKWKDVMQPSPSSRFHPWTIREPNPWNVQYHVLPLLRNPQRGNFWLRSSERARTRPSKTALNPTPSSGAFGTSVAGKNALFCGKKVLFCGKKEGDTRVLRSVMFTLSGLVVCASRRFWQTERVQPGLMQDRMNAVTIWVFTLLFFEGRMPLNPCTFFPD